jgi:hypothetical protein
MQYLYRTEPQGRQNHVKKNLKLSKWAK